MDANIRAEAHLSEEQRKELEVISSKPLTAKEWRHYANTLALTYVQASAQAMAYEAVTELIKEAGLDNVPLSLRKQIDIRLVQSATAALMARTTEVLDERHGTDVPVRIIRSTIKLIKERLVQDSGIPALMALFE